MTAQTAPPEERKQPLVLRILGEIAAFGKLVRDEWQNNGSWIGVVQIPAGMQPEFYDLVNKLSKGEAETKLLR